ncbi:hypothetical protein V7S43_000619 [Phytophthora oleae]|uniref:Peptidase S1 domain-containing protein n=1 Tax=Phytophthora oleae TaxID=2107226 RepID=A0ABD3GA50_9STRA
MKIVQAGAFVAALGSLSTFVHGYSFSDVSKTTEASQESTGLTTNEESRIYGGSDANIDKVPFLASLRDPFLDETFCAGTLIAPQYILTAGHCIKTDAMTIIATFGTNDSTGSGSGSDEATKIEVIKGFRHPLYKKKEHLYDVGLLKLEKPIKRKTAKLCAADGSDNKVGTMGTVFGWGKTEDSSGMQSPTLEQLTIPVISNAECGKFKKYVDRVTEGMLCAGTGNGKDTCNGDSGGPLLVDGNILIGCVSWGSKCGQQAGIYTRLTYVMDYIEDILAGGDGSKFSPNGTSSELVPEETSSGSDDLSWLFEGSGSIDFAALLDMLKNSSGSGSDLFSGLDGSNSESGSGVLLDSESASGSEDTVPVKGGKATKAPIEESSESASEETDVPATKGKTTKTPVAVDDSESGSDDLSWLLDSDSASGSEDPTLVKGATKGKATKAPVATDDSESGSEDPALVKGAKKGKATKAPVATDESGSEDLSWLLDIDSDSDSASGSEDPTLVKGATKGKATKTTTAASGSHDIDWLFASESDSGSEDSVPATKATKSTKATKAPKIAIEEDSASTSMSGSEDSAHQSEQVMQQSFK